MKNLLTAGTILIMCLGASGCVIDRISYYNFYFPGRATYPANSKLLNSVVLGKTQTPDDEMFANLRKAIAQWLTDYGYNSKPSGLAMYQLDVVILNHKLIIDDLYHDVYEAHVRYTLRQISMQQIIFQKTITSTLDSDELLGDAAKSKSQAEQEISKRAFSSLLELGVLGSITPGARGAYTQQIANAEKSARGEVVQRNIQEFFRLISDTQL